MSELIEELSAKGFEIVKDEAGQDLVKLVFMDESDEATGYALVSPEDAKRILSGKATLQNVTDEDGKQVLTLVPLDNEEPIDNLDVPDPPAEDSIPKTTSALFPEDDSKLLDSGVSPTLETHTAPDTQERSKEDENIPPVSTDQPTAMDVTEDVQQFVLNEETSVVDNKTVQVVTLLDSRGQVLDQKHGNTGEQVVLELHGQMLSYELQGPSESGEPITSTLLMSTGDRPVEEQAPVDSGVTELNDTTLPSTPWAGTVNSADAPQTAEVPVGQQFTLTEVTTMIDGEAFQTVVLADENGSVLDQKQGHAGEHVIIEMSGNSLEYVFLGPTENGEPITTTLMVSSEPDVPEQDTAHEAAHMSPVTSSEAISTAADWCPLGLPPEFYSALCRQVEHLIATRIPRNPDGSSPYRPEPYHRKLGSLTTYQEMTVLFHAYRLGSRNGETLTQYENLRNFAKIYRPSGPQSRALTKFELAMNEAAAQICRYHPGLLFHKRELFHLAKDVVEHSQNSISMERRRTMEQLSHPQPISSVMPHHPLPRPTPHHPLSHAPSLPPTAVVSGRVASSQLAMLESRGLSGIIHPPASSTAVTNLQTLPTSRPGDIPVDRMPSTTTVTTSANAIDEERTGAQSSIPESSSVNSGALPNKREIYGRLTSPQEDALRSSALNLIMELPPFDLKPKTECTNIELACWEQANLLATQVPPPGSIEAVSNFLNNEKRLASVREAAALYGRNPSSNLYSVQNSMSASSVASLIPYEVACNEAATYLASVVPQLLTHRRELSELAKKVVRNSGCLFTNTSGFDKMPVGAPAFKFYCPDQLPELDLSAADQILTDPLDRSDTPDSGCCLSPVTPESSELATNLQTLALSCEECNNIVDDVAIYSATGTDSLKKVRILSLAGCAFTGILPIHLNQCSNLIELNLSNNALCAFPRCLHLPKLKRLNLRNNPRLLSTEPPLIEQFPRLVSVELDAPLVKLLSRQALVCLCPYLKYINGEEFVEEPSEETVKVLQSAKHQLSTLIYSKWEDDIAGFYKKGLPKRDTTRVIETLVLHAVKRCVDIGHPFAQCTCVLARRVAEDFLSPKMLDDEYEDDTAEKMQPVDEPSEDEENVDSESDLEEDEESEPAKTSTVDDQIADGKTVDKLGVAAKPKLKKGIVTEASVAEREAQAAAENWTLLPDEPSDRLINVVGQALRHGKTVVYAVIRTAARQPDGELIPVGGGLGVTSSTTCASPTAYSSKPTPVQVEVESSSPAAQEEAPEEIHVSVETIPSSLPERPVKPSQSAKKSSSGPRRYSQKKVLQPSPAPAPEPPVSKHSRRPGLLSRGTPSKPATPIKASVSTSKLPTAPASLPSLSIAHTMTTDSVSAPLPSTSSIQPEPQTQPVVYTIHQRPLLPSDYIIKPSRSESQPAYVVPTSALQRSVKPKTPARRGRPPSTQAVIKKTPVTPPVQRPAPLLPPHSPPPSSMHMSTRDSNRLKRFSAYGIIEASTTTTPDKLSAALPMDSVAAKKQVEVMCDKTQNVTVTPVKTKLEAIDPLEASAREDAMVVLLDTCEAVLASPQKPTEIPANSEEETLAVNLKAVARSRRRRAHQQSPIASQPVPTTPPEADNAKRPRRMETSTPVGDDAADTSRVGAHSITELGSVVDYDPLHFIRCHARDNDPLDCKTKVWRCAFEPSLEDPNQTSTIVATCGGECVCLIDCRSGRVMKRFKHLNEEFYSLAWTTVEMAVGHRTNLLAAAGKLREIRLLHPEQLVCYAEMRGHKDDVACMIFHPEKPTILFSGDSKAMIYVWDIGIPSAPEYRTRHQLLMKLACPRPQLNPVLNLIFLPKFETLVAGCEDGIFSWNFSDFRKQKSSEERQPDIEMKIPTRHEPCFDGLARLSDNLIVVKCVEEGELYVVDYAQVSQRIRRSTPSKKPVPVEIRGQLRWQNTDEIYINVTACSNLYTVVCGDNEGTIWLYDLQKYVEEDSRKFKVKPIKILEWPECSVGGAKDDDAPMKESITSGFKNPVVNATDISHDGQYLVAVTDNNLVCIWKFSG